MDIACFSRCGEKRQKRKIRSIMDKRNTELLRTITSYLKSYDGPELRIMEVCGSHTGAIAKYGIPQLLSDRIHLISGPGCPVCVAPSAYIDRMIELSLQPDVIVTTFGDLLRVPGSRESLSEAKGRGAKARMVYSPFDTIDLAKKDPAHTYVFAALGFETTAPVYALMARQVLCISGAGACVCRDRQPDLGTAGGAVRNSVCCRRVSGDRDPRGALWNCAVDKRAVGRKGHELLPVRRQQSRK